MEVVLCSSPPFGCRDTLKKERRKCKHYWHVQGMEVVLCSAPPIGCRDIQHPTWRIKRGDDFN
jgi:hypothetical protein